VHPVHVPITWFDQFPRVELQQIENQLSFGLVFRLGRQVEVLYLPPVLMLTWNPPFPDPKNLFPPASLTSGPVREKRSASSRGLEADPVRKESSTHQHTCLRIVRLEVAAAVVVDEHEGAFPP
jgi:hypothetical protein